MLLLKQRVWKRSEDDMFNIDYNYSQLTDNNIVPVL